MVKTGPLGAPANKTRNTMECESILPDTTAVDMPRFDDKWVVDRTLFEFATGGSCACCGLSHLFLPDGLKGLIDEVSDLETDAANNEFEAAQKSPWPPTMRDQVWADRVRLRHLLKKEMGQYATFMAEVGGTEGLKRFLLEEIGPSKLRRILQMPRTEVPERVRSQYGIHSALGNVICAAVEQVANFELTKYPADGRSEAELAFESMLKYDRRGGFVFPIAKKNEETRTFDTMNVDALDALVATVESLGGPKLLHRAPKKTKPIEKTGDSDEGDDSDDDEGGADDADEAPVPGQTGPSFRSDRRIVRLLIARYWADQIIQKCSTLKKNREAEEKESGQAGQDDTTNSEDNVEAVTAGVESLSTT